MIQSIVIGLSLIIESIIRAWESPYELSDSDKKEIDDGLADFMVGWKVRYYEAGKL